MQIKGTRGRKRVLNEETGALCLGVAKIANKKIETRGDSGDLA